MSDISNAISEAVDRTELLTLAMVLDMIKNYDRSLLIEVLSETVKEKEAKLKVKYAPEVDDDGFELPHLDPEDDPETRKRMEAEQ